MNSFMCRTEIGIVSHYVELYKGKPILAYINSKCADEELMLLERITKGDEDALSDLYDIYSRLVYSLILKIVKNREEAEDLMQSLFIKIWHKASFFDKTKGNVYSWITAMARNSAIDRIRSKHYRNTKNNIDELDEYMTSGSNEEITGLDYAIIKERSEIVSKALKIIPEEQSLVIELAYFQGLTQSEMAEELNIPLGTVKTRMRQALIKMEKILSPLYEYGN